MKKIPLKKLYGFYVNDKFQQVLAKNSLEAEKYLSNKYPNSEISENVSVEIPIKRKQKRNPLPQVRYETLILIAMGAAAVAYYYFVFKPNKITAQNATAQAAQNAAIASAIQPSLNENANAANRYTGQVMSGWQ
jgi:hypothetical protein